MEEIKADLKRVKTSQQNVSDAEDELLMLDDSDAVPFKIGDSFIEYNSDSVQQKIEAEKEKLQAEIKELLKREEDVNKEMAKLKVELYGKFGNNINLEPEAD